MTERKLKDWDVKVITSLPRLFEPLPYTIENHLCYGFEIYPGWRNMLSECLLELNAIVEKHDTAIYISRVKQKFGYMVIYYVSTDHRFNIPDELKKELGEVIIRYYELSGKTCECCGKPSEVRNVSGLATTACDECVEERIESRNRAIGELFNNLKGMKRSVN